MLLGHVDMEAVPTPGGGSPLLRWISYAIRQQWKAEAWALMRRPRQRNDRSQRPVAGLALSGGGIRSATSNLGVLVALGTNKQIYKFDYLSTVSGGSFTGGLFARRGPGFAPASVFDPEGYRFLLRPDASPRLCQFGRYLAPGGTGDMLRDFTTALRNVTAIHVALKDTSLAAK
jgi:hypothetical protein